MKAHARPIVCKTLLLLACLIATRASGSAYGACPICCSGPGTFLEELAVLEGVAVARLVRHLPLDQESGLTPVQVELIDVLKVPKTIHAGDQLVVKTFAEIQADHFVYLTRHDAKSSWHPIPITPRCRDYILQLTKLTADPNLTKDPKSLVRHLWRHVEDRDEIIRNDAFRTFNDIPFKQWIALTPDLDHDQLIAWINDPEIVASRRRAYLKLLSLCGNESDVQLLEGLITSKDKKSRAAFDGVILCYLALAGEAALPLIEEQFLANPRAEIADSYSAIVAVRFHLEHPSRLPKPRLAAALKLMLKRPELADLVIADLALMEDWSIAEEVFELFKSAETKDSDWVRVPAIQYLRKCPLAMAKAMLKECESLDPKAVERADRLRPL